LKVDTHSFAPFLTFLVYLQYLCPVLLHRCFRIQSTTPGFYTPGWHLCLYALILHKI
jgi:hypothetical protein